MITLLTASMPERGPLLQEAVASVNAQTIQVPHVIGVDHLREGAPKVYLRLAYAADTPWITFLDDDDLLDDDHIETLLGAIDDEVDVVYAGCRTEGHHFGNYNRSFDARTLQRLSIVPVTAAVRREMFLEAGGFPPVRDYDWELWKSLARAGARFRAIPRITWTYRHVGRNSSHGHFLNGVLSG